MKLCLKYWYIILIIVVVFFGMVCVYVYSDYMGVIMMLEVVVDEIEVGVFFLVGMIID